MIFLFWIFVFFKKSFKFFFFVNNSRERLVQIMFEKYGYQACYVAIQAVLTLYAQGLFVSFWKKFLIFFYFCFFYKQVFWLVLLLIVVMVLRTLFQFTKVFFKKNNCWLYLIWKKKLNFLKKIYRIFVATFDSSFGRCWSRSKYISLISIYSI